MEKINVLLVDDKPGNLLSLEAILSNEELNLIKASSGKDALSLMLDHDFALVLLDVQMPDMDGFETAKLIRGTGKTKDIPIIFLTAINKEQQYVFKGYESGAVDYLFKPLNDDVLRSKVKVFTNLYRQRKMIDDQRIRLDVINRELDSCVHAMSHDLASPLRNLIKFASFFKQKYQERFDEESFKNIDSILSSAEKMQSLMQSFLDFTCIGKTDAQKESVNILDLVHEAMSLLKSDIEESKAVIKTEGDFSECFCFKPRVTQVFMILLDNAIKYVPEGHAPNITIGCRHTNGFEWYFIKDDGIGIDQEHYWDIFDAFKRLHDTRSPYKGSGIGLSNVKKVIDLHAGEIYLSSSKGNGTTFYFSFSGAEQQRLKKILLSERLISQYPSVGHENGNVNVRGKNYSLDEKDERLVTAPKLNKHLLVVDDDPDAIVLFKDIIEMENVDFSVSYVTNGQDAVDYVFGRGKYSERKTYPMCSVILLDINMPVLNGFGVLKVVKSEASFEKIPIIAMFTSSHAPRDKQQALDMGANDYVTKDIDNKELIEKIKNIFSSLEKVIIQD